MKKLITYITTSLAILTSIIVFGNKLVDFIDKLKAEKIQLQETLKQRTVSYYENLTYYQNELGQTIQETEICETKQKVIEQTHDEIINQYEKITDSLTEVIIDKEVKAEIKAEDLQPLVKNKLSVNNSSNIQLKQSTVISLKNKPVLKQKVFKRLFAKVKRNK